MRIFDYFRSSFFELNEEQAEQLQHSHRKWYSVEVRPPQKRDTPATLTDFVSGILEIQNKWWKLRNTSPVTAYEIRRPRPDTLKFQFSTPTKRLERKVRTQLSDQLPGTQFTEGVNGLPVLPGDTLGGGLLTAGEPSYHSFNTDYSSPPINALTALLHRHSMRNTKFVIQILFQPVAGRPIRNWWWRKAAVKHRNYLKREKQQIWGSTKPTRREKQQANQIDYKIGNARFWTSIRLLIIGAKDYTPSRVKELAGGFNRFDNPETSQYFNATTIQPFLNYRLLDFAEALRDRHFGGWSRKFKTTSEELAALLSLPNRNQSNVNYTTFR